MTETPDHSVHLLATDGWRAGGRTFIEKNGWTITVQFFGTQPLFQLWHGRINMGTFTELASAKGYQDGWTEGKIGNV